MVKLKLGLIGTKPLFTASDGIVVFMQCAGHTAMHDMNIAAVDS